MVQEQVNTDEEQTKDSFMARPYKNADRERQDEEELQRLEEEHRQATAKANGTAEPEEPEVHGEEKTFKKRYGDLRRHMAEKTKEMQEKIESLERQMKEATSKTMAMPKTDEEMEQWMKDNSDIAAFIETLASKRIREAKKEMDNRFEEINKRDRQTQEEAALLKLRETHPDFDDLSESDEFHEWLEVQPEIVQKSLYEDATDWRSASRVIDLYKADMGKQSKKNTRKSADREAASNVNARERTNVGSDTGPRSFKESEIERMTDAEYAEHEEEIEAANRQGRIIRDLTGAAR